MERASGRRHSLVADLDCLADFLAGGGGPAGTYHPTDLIRLALLQVELILKRIDAGLYDGCDDGPARRPSSN